MIGLGFLFAAGSPILFFLSVAVVWAIGKASLRNEEADKLEE